MTNTSTARHDVRFESGEGWCGAWLYLPAGATATNPAPIIVLAHGFGGIKEMGLDRYAERFLDEGYACLVFDYRHFGDSSGEPRELVDVDRELEDWRAAVAFARQIPQADADRVILWGTSFAGGHVITTAANDPAIAATIAQCPFTDGLAAGMSMPFFTAMKLMRQAIRDRRAAHRGLEPIRIGVVGAPGDLAIMSSPDSLQGFKAILAASNLTEWPDMVPARVMFQVPRYRPGRRAKDIRTPTLFCICDRDSVTPPRKTEKYAAQAARSEVIHYDAGHFDIYVGDAFENVIREQIAFIRKHVPANAS
ncbi:alpha/beta hydrolase [Nocardia sp. CA-135398]|uniref:alpha/beta hydrolase n=1 Tax=Nocardia sp. CA-135398 TaxID=3239977 RepID=UPI003D999E8C